MAARVLYGVVVRSEPHDSEEKSLIAEGNAWESRLEEVVRVVDQAVVKMRDVFAKVFQVELELMRKERPVGLQRACGRGSGWELGGVERGRSEAGGRPRGHQGRGALASFLRRRIGSLAHKGPSALQGEGGGRARFPGQSS